MDSVPTTTPTPTTPTLVDNHQLSLLPDLEQEPSILVNPYLWLLGLFIVGSLAVITICGCFQLSGVATTWIVSGSTLFTVACGSLGANGVAKKGIYISAASKDGIYNKDIITPDSGNGNNNGQQPQ